MLISSFRTNPGTNALIRTTTAITRAKGSDASNVIASVAEITVNFRLLPGDTLEDVMNHVREICKGYDVEIEVINAREASGISPQDTRGFRIIQEALDQTYPGAVVTAYITIGGTDAYKYQIVSDHIYRLMPVYLNAYEQRMLHNENEHITIENYGKMIRYFRTIMENY
ncbi:MAG: M20/M25/M40 family metallo-hydrolase [Tannerellaceae bacterium]|nr:M20/M25/M40 family metallo-hydrolase [Tannerellaceae bacterium]